MFRRHPADVLPPDPFPIFPAWLNRPLHLEFLQTPEEPRPSLPTSRPSQQDWEPDTSEEGSRPPSSCSEGRRDTAARILQTRWKVYRRQVRDRGGRPYAAWATGLVPRAWVEMQNGLDAARETTWGLTSTRTCHGRTRSCRKEGEVSISALSRG